MTADLPDEALTGHDLVLVRQLPASPMAVWRCWTEPELLK